MSKARGGRRGAEFLLLAGCLVVVVLAEKVGTTSPPPKAEQFSGGASVQKHNICQPIKCDNGGVQDAKTCKCKCPSPYVGGNCRDMMVGPNNGTLREGTDWSMVNDTTTFHKGLSVTGDVTIVGMAAFETRLRNNRRPRPIYVMSGAEVTRSLSVLVAQVEGDTEAVGGAILTDVIAPKVRDTTVDGSCRSAGTIKVVTIEGSQRKTATLLAGGQIKFDKPSSSAVHIDNHLIVGGVLQTEKMTITHQELSIEGKLGIQGHLVVDTIASLFDRGVVQIQGSLKVGEEVLNATHTGPMIAGQEGQGEKVYGLYVSTLRPYDGATTIPVLGTVEAKQHVEAAVVRSVIGRYLNMNGILVRSGDHVEDVRSVLPSFEVDTLQPNATDQVKNNTMGAPGSSASPLAGASSEAWDLENKLGDFLKSGRDTDISGARTSLDGTTGSSSSSSSSPPSGSPSYGSRGFEPGPIDHTYGGTIGLIQESVEADEVGSDSQAFAGSALEVGEEANPAPSAASAPPANDAEFASTEKARAEEYAQANLKLKFKENWCGGDIKRQTELNFPGARLFSVKHVATGLGNGLKHCSLFQGIEMCPAIIELTVFSETGVQFVLTLHTGRYNDRTYMYTVVPGVFARRQDDNSWEVAGLGDNALYNFRFSRAECRIQLRTVRASVVTVVATGKLFLLDDFYYKKGSDPLDVMKEEEKKQLEKDEGALAKVASKIDKDIKAEESPAEGALELAESSPLMSS